MKKNRKIMAFTLMFTLIIAMFCVFSNTAIAAPAPALTSVDIIDLALDDNNEIHIAVREIGTSSSGNAWWNGSLCTENINERVNLWNSSNIRYGCIKYYRTGVYYSSSLSGTYVSVQAQATNAMSPWNTLSDYATFVLP
ncbi:MAG: YolA family protein [Clostridia bacterium]|nr:YolA family protein [Clostridia bacterium]